MKLFERFDQIHDAEIIKQLALLNEHEMTSLVEINKLSIAWIYDDPTETVF